MRTLALTSILGITLLNCFLAYSGLALAQEMQRSAIHAGARLSLLAQAAFALQPWFYVVALIATIVAGVGFGRRLSERTLMQASIGFLILDVVGLIISLWGFCQIHLSP